MQFKITVKDVIEYATTKDNAIEVVERLAREYPGETVTAVDQITSRAFSSVYRPRPGCAICED
jgi:hypothetical protein